MITNDYKDIELLVERRRQWNLRAGPRVGDYVEMLDGSLRRLTHDWGDGIQTTVPPRHPCYGDSSFYICQNGTLSFSGSLGERVQVSALIDTGRTLRGSVWFFHHDVPAAGAGVSGDVVCRVYRQAPPPSAQQS